MDIDSDGSGDMYKAVSDDDKVGFWESAFSAETIICMIIMLVVGFVLGLIYCW